MHGGQLDVSALRTWAWTAHGALRKHRALINALNAFPAADEDTGTNMLRFWEAFGCALLAVSDGSTVGHAIRSAAADSISVEGNSVTITYRWLTGLGVSLADVTAAGPDHLASALDEAARRARQQLADPVDGTMLTVFDAAARLARAALSEGATTARMTAQIARGVRTALAEYPVPVCGAWQREPPEEDSGAFAARLLLHALSMTTALLDDPPEPLCVPSLPEPSVLVPAARASAEAGCELQAIVLADEAALGVLATAPDVEALNIAEIPLSSGRWHLHLHTPRTRDPLSVLGEGITVVDHRITSLEPHDANSRAVVDGPQQRVLVVALRPEDFAVGLARALEAAANEILVVMVGENPGDALTRLVLPRRDLGLAAALIPCASEHAAVAAAEAFSVADDLHSTVLAMFAASRAATLRERTAATSLPRPGGPDRFPKVNLER
ncbi:DAK2 domain-containing protein [Streptomyces pseudogriseolus]|uniref:DAK2 domain-containing protein n=1 Tax=Streptomyces pseudogriseolus TaxID=36817 RepID=UPI0034839220